MAAPVGAVVGAINAHSDKEVAAADSSLRAAFAEVQAMRAQVSAVRQQVQNLCRAGNKIQAIKHYREATGVGLKEAKDAVEEFQRRAGLA